MTRSFECNLTFVRGPVHSLYHPVRLPTDRPAILDDPSLSYRTKVLFALFPETSLVVALLPQRTRSSAAIALLALWPLFVAAREAFVQWGYLMLGWALLHAALPSDAGYDVSLVDVMRVGAVGGAMIQAVSLGIFVMLPALIRVALGVPQWKEPASAPQGRGSTSTRPMAKFNVVQHLVSAIFMAPSEMAGAAMAGAWGTLLLKHSVADASSLMDTIHAVRAGVVGAVVLWVPQVLWYLLNVYFVRRDVMKAEAQSAHPDAGAIENAIPQCTEGKSSVNKDVVGYDI